MKWPIAILGLLGALSGLVSADTAGDLQALVKARAAYPPCAAKCVRELLPTSPCALTDLKCMCTNEDLTKATEACILHECSVWEGLQTQNVTMTMCGAPIRDKHITPLVINVVGGSLAVLAFVMRICTFFLKKSGRTAGADDYICGIAVILAAPPTFFAFIFKDNGFGHDIWTLQLHNIRTVLKFLYLSQVFYIACITTVKISLVCFLLRVFPDERFRRVCYVVMGLVAAYGISFTTATALQCWPASYAWHQIDEDHEGTCNNVHLQAWMAAIFNIALDVILLILPLRSLWALQMGLKKKLMIMGMFSLGIFVTIISIVRLHSLVKFANSKNITWDYVEAAYWSLIEMHISILCACLPYCRFLLVHFGASFLKTRSGGSKTYESRAGHTSRYDTRLDQTRNGTTVTSGKAAEAQQPPKRGDESDFVPLVEYPNRNWDKQTTISATHTFESTDSN